MSVWFIVIGRSVG